jgi:hypothetical protein
MTMARSKKDITANFHGGNPHSVAAHRRASGCSEVDRQRITNLLQQHNENGLICDEIEVILGMGHQTASARLADLKKDRVVRVRGRRNTRSGSSAGVNFLISVGRSAIA